MSPRRWRRPSLRPTLLVGGFTPDGTAVAFGEGPRLVLLDLATFTERAPTTDHTVPVQALAVSRDDDAVTLAGTREARWWSMRDAAPLYAAPLYAAPLHAAPLAAYVTGLRPLPEPDRYVVTAASRIDDLELDVAARTLAPRAPPPDTHQEWRGRTVRATDFRGRLTLTDAAGVAVRRGGGAPEPRQDDSSVRELQQRPSGACHLSAKIRRKARQHGHATKVVATVAIPSPGVEHVILNDHHARPL